MHTPLDNAIAALAIAKQCGGELDTAHYEKAHSDLVQMREAIIVHDQRLNDEGKAPEGDDYNALLSILGLPTAS